MAVPLLAFFLVLTLRLPFAALNAPIDDEVAASSTPAIRLVPCASGPPGLSTDPAASVAELTLTVCCRRPAVVVAKRLMYWQSLLQAERAKAVRDMAVSNIRGIASVTELRTRSAGASTKVASIASASTARGSGQADGVPFFKVCRACLVASRMAIELDAAPCRLSSSGSAPAALMALALLRAPEASWSSAHAACS